MGLQRFGLTTRHYQGRVEAHIRRYNRQGRQRAGVQAGAVRKVTWAPSPLIPSAPAEAREAAIANISANWWRLPQLARLEVPGWALRDEHGVKPSYPQFVEDPAEYIMALLDRTADLCVPRKWRGLRVSFDGDPPVAQRYGCLHFAAKQGASQVRRRDGTTTTTPVHGLDNLCLPLRVPPTRRRRLPMRKRHFLQTMRGGYVRVYLGTTGTGSQSDGRKSAPVYEYLHRLIQLAFSDELPEDGKETSHCCCNPWCGSMHHMAWASHRQNQGTRPQNARNNGNVRWGP